jgi:predicted secreted protein
MRWTSIVAIYLLFWVMSAFLVMPFGIRTHEEAGEALVPGQATSAPANFRPGRVALRATLLSAVAFGLFYANLHYGWVSVDDISVIHPPAALRSASY